MKKFILAAATLVFLQVSAQKEDIAFFGGVHFPKAAQENLIGGDFNLRYYVTDDLSLGGGITWSSKKYRDGFGYHTDRTNLINTTYNFNVQYDFLKSERFIASGFLSNGVQTVGLRNLNDITVEEQYDEYGNPYYVETAKLLNRDVFYILTPGIDLSFKLAEISEEDQVGLYLTSRTGYQMAFGKDMITNTSNPNNLIFSIGVTFKGTTKSLE